MLRITNADAGSREIGYVRRALAEGELVIVPTDTLYGIAADASNEQACRRLYDVKGRAADQPTAIICSSIDELLDALPTTSLRARIAFEALLPGPWTLLVGNPDSRFLWACGNTPHVIGIRVPAEALALQPLMVTSANLPGAADITDITDLPEQIVRDVVCAVDTGTLDEPVASTVLDLTAWETGTGDVHVVRDRANRAPHALDLLAGIGHVP